MLAGLFALGALTALLLAFLARWVAAVFVHTGMSAQVGLAFALGAVATRGVNSDMPTTEMAMGFGAMVGLAAAWWLFFKRETVDG